MLVFGKLTKMSYLLRFVFNLLVINLIAFSLSYAQDSQNLSTNQISKFDNVKEIADIEVGSPTAPLKIIEYSALNCAHCARFHNTFFPQLHSKYIATGKARFIYRYFSIDLGSVHAMAVVAALPQNKWFDAITTAYKKQNEWMGKDLTVLAKVCGVSPEDSKKNTQNQHLLDSIIAKRFNAEQRLTINATPTFHLISPKGDIFINTPITDAELEKKITSLL
jgi:protein-disulfide isomerase